MITIIIVLVMLFIGYMIYTKNNNNTSYVPVVISERTPFYSSHPRMPPFPRRRHHSRPLFAGRPPSHQPRR